VRPHGEPWTTIHSRHPTVRAALRSDALIALRYRSEASQPSSPLEVTRAVVRLAWMSDAFLAQALYRVKARLQAMGVPVLPRLAHRLAIVTAGVSIGDPVVVEAGIYIIHGQVVIDGLVEIGAGVVVGPFVTIGLRAGDFRGPTIERDVHIGTGAKIIGPVRVGAGSVIGAGAVVVDDVPASTTVVGIPARPMAGGRS
jgi:serine O-acetyltransferase